MNTAPEPVKYIASSNFKMIEPPTDETIGMWRDMFKQSLVCPDLCIDGSWQDTLTSDQKDLFAVLTKRLTEHFALIGFTETILNEEK